MATRSAWPIKAEHPAELPPPLDTQLTGLLVRGEQLLQLIALPADDSAPRRGAWARTRGVQVLALTDQRVIVGVQAVPRGEVPWVALPYAAIVAWELSVTLLYGLLDLWGQQDGAIVRTSIEFNTVGLPIIEAALAPLERHTLGSTRQDEPRARPRPPIDSDLPFKFGNFLHDALLPGEPIRALVFQEAVLAPVFRLWRRLLTPGTLIVGTDRRLLVIREEAKVGKDRYGHLALSLPCRWAGDLAIQESETWQTLTFAPEPKALTLLVAHTQAAALAALVRALQGKSYPLMAVGTREAHARGI
jgi:hypothetical protein